MSATRQRTVGIVGGMGPWATALFFENLLRLTPVRKDWDHIHVVIDSHPQIPSRTRHYLFGETSPVPAMIEVARRLAIYPVDFIVVPCNSASYFLPEVRAAVGLPILDIFAITAAALAARVGPGTRTAVLGGVITHRERCYAGPLAAAGLTHVVHGDAVQERIEALIEALKLDPHAPGAARTLDEVLARLRDQYSVAAAILGCTELGFAEGERRGLTIVDSNLELARATVALARE